MDALKESKSPRPFVKNNTGDMEWYTPPHIVEKVRQALRGGIDLDPASSAEANKIVKAEVYYDKETDGLRQPWAGRVFLNPPYKAGLVGKFVQKLVLSKEQGTVTQAILLTNNATETKWFQNMVMFEDVSICFVKSRISFVKPGQETGKPLQGQVIVYWGEYPNTFAKAFGDMGTIGTILRHELYRDVDQYWKQENMYD